MNKFLKQIIAFFGFSLTKIADKNRRRYEQIYCKYNTFTMMPKDLYIETIAFVENLKALEGNVVECGVWRGGMIAGMAEVLGKHRKYYLCDSFEGLPKAKEIDGKAALDWQLNVTGSTYHDNCTAEENLAKTAMKMAKVDFELKKGWFDKTMPMFKPGNIAFLRLDADWYDSMYCCLEHLYKYVINGGIIIIDDYYVWDGCSKAVHAFLAQTSSRIYHTKNGVTYIIKNE